MRSPIAKFLSEAELAAFRSEPGSTVLFGADDPAVVSRVLGALRLHLGRELGLIDEDAWRFVWMTDFPMFEWDEEDGRWKAVHHPFTRPAPGSEELVTSDPALQTGRRTTSSSTGSRSAAARSGSTSRSSRRRSSRCCSCAAEEQRRKFGFLLDALAMGAPPHGGIAFGIERMLMALGREPNLRDMIAFPKNQAGRRSDERRALGGRGGTARGAWNSAACAAGMRTWIEMTFVAAVCWRDGDPSQPVRSRRLRAQPRT